MIDCFKDKYTPVCDTEIKKCAKSYCKPIDFRPDYYLYKLYTFVELLSVNRYIVKKYFFTVVIGPTPFNFMVIYPTNPSSRA